MQAAISASFSLAFEVCTGEEGEPCFPNIPLLSPAALPLLAFGFAASGLWRIRSRRDGGKAPG